VENNNFTIATLTEQALIDASRYDDMIINSTVQILKRTSDTSVDPRGSGILLKVASKGILLTASHVLSEDLDNNVIPLNGFLFQVPGGVLTRGVKTSALSSRHGMTEDSVDIAIVVLEDEVTQKLERVYSFISIDDCMCDHVVTPGGLYVANGFPISKTSFYGGGVRAKNYLAATNGFPDFDYQQFGFDPNSSLAVRWDGHVKDPNNGKKRKAPFMYGMSGCGLWNFPLSGNPGDLVLSPRLVGVVTDQQSKPGSAALVATKFDVFSEVLRTVIGLSIPASQILRIPLSAEGKDGTTQVE
jgi:hypothetical protein